MQQSYKVLARKYRPQDFSSLKGQDALVKTITNAVKNNRLSHAFLLTGIRGVGKTTSARIIAKLVNCENLDLSTDNIKACNQCSNCIACNKENHPDILELDAASKTGVNDIRELIENAGYLPLIAKYKVFIIDEVHMLSNNAFNALLKILEEPPAHIIFIFATTELRKIPITIISRCQKFELKRLSYEEIAAHLKFVCKEENVEIEDEAANIIAVNSEGSVRDSLSILDQAIVSCSEESSSKVMAEKIRQMLGISSKEQIFSLFEHIIVGNTKAALDIAANIYQNGSEPQMIVQDLLFVINLLSKAVIDESSLNNANYTQKERELAKNLLSKLSITALSTLWQMIVKSVAEVENSYSPIASLEIMIIKLCHFANLPSPGELITSIINSGATSLDAAQKKTAFSSPNSYKELTKLFLEKREILLYQYLHDEAVPVDFKQGRLELLINEYAPKDFAKRTSDYLKEWTGQNWTIILSSKNDGPICATLKDEKQAILSKELEDIKQEPIVKAVLDKFEGSAIISVKNI